jgi:UDP-glucose 4-epimerase
MSAILVCGGAGYIGSHMVRRLQRDGFRVTVFDNLSTGHSKAVSGVDLIEGDVLDAQALANLFAKRRIDAVMHFCALSIVTESLIDPLRYYRNNVIGTLNLIDAMRQANVDRLVFSSSAAVFGNPVMEKIDEAHPTNPINPYGASKLMVERMLSDAASAYGLRSVALRYFNAAGADSIGDIGESHSPETHLLPNILECALGLAESRLQVFGTDYDTRDGTCVRDYVHVNDLVDAHLCALTYLEKTPGAHRFNLGSGTGYSVLELIQAARKITGKPIPYSAMPRRAGDPPTLVADSNCAEANLGWRREFGLPDIIESAWRWHCDPRY